MSNIQANNFKVLGNAAFADKKYEEAIGHFTKAIEHNPNDHVFYSNRSACYASLEDYDKALEDATKCVNLKPDWARGYARKGLAEFYLGLYDEAEKTYTQGLELEPTNQQFKEGLERVKESKESEGGDAGGDAGGFGGNFMQQAFGKLLSNPETAAYFQDPEFVKKITAIQKNPQSISLYMNDPKIQKAFQVILSDFGGGAGFGGPGGAGAGAGAGAGPTGTSFKGADESGATFADETHTSIPKKEEPKPQPKAEPPKPKASSNVSPADDEKNKGNDEYKKKNFDKAITHYQKAIELDPNEPIYYNNLAAVYLEQKQYDKAIDSCNKAEEVVKSGHFDYVKYAKILARKAAAYGHKGDYDKSLEFYQQSLLENNDTKVKDEMRKVEKTKKDKAEKEYINPELAEQHRLKGNELYGQAKYPDAIKEYDEAVKRNPSDHKLYANRGTALMKLMEYPTALKDIDKCLELDPTYVKAYAKKGVIHHFLKEYHKALEVYEKGLKIDPDNEECKSGIEKTRYAIMSASGNETKEDQAERLKRAMDDPEVRAILQDPLTMQLLRDLQERPQDPNNMAALRDPTVAKKIDKLISAGVLRMG
jgi:stress-induced-phosphoprotein 1